MSKTQRKNLASLLSLVITGLAFFIINLFQVELLNNILISILVFVVSESILINTLSPKQKTSKKKTPKKSSQQKTSRKPTGNPFNVLNDDDLLITPIDELSGHDFEKLVFLYMKAHSRKYKEVEQTNHIKDKGVDIIYKDNQGFKVAVQVKNRTESNKKITTKELDAINGAKRSHSCQRAHFITTNEFTADSKALAKQHSIIIDGHEFIFKIDDWRKNEAKKKKLIS